MSRVPTVYIYGEEGLWKFTKASLLAYLEQPDPYAWGDYTKQLKIKLGVYGNYITSGLPKALASDDGEVYSVRNGVEVAHVGDVEDLHAWLGEELLG